MKMGAQRTVNSGLFTVLSLICSAIGTPSVERLRDPLVYYIQEELPAGHVVGHMIPDADLSGSYSLDELTVLQYKFIASPSGYDELFNLTQDGTLLTATEIDRDLLCPMEQECVLSLDIEISPIQYFQIIKVNIVLLDINDNEPEFEESVMYLSLSESTPVGSVIPIPMAYDPDSPENGIDHYQLRVQDATARQVFGLKANGDIHDLLGEIYLEVLDHLDREEKSRYFLKIVAFEGYKPEGKQTVLLVHVSVTDVNDNMPEFSQSKYTVRVPENISVGTPLVRVTATDLDSGENSQISYAFSQRTLQNYGSVFSVDTRTGDIITQQPIDYELENHYNLVVVASDRKEDTLTAEAVVSIEVTDVNDNAPVITVTSLGSDADHIQVEENADPETPLAHISVMDPDEGLGGIVTCELNDTRFNLSQIYASDFMLQAINILDREDTPNLGISITCRDNGNPELVSREVIQIDVMDVNDNAPTFDEDEYIIVTAGNIRNGDNLFQVSATDRDTNQNANITYSLIGADINQLFYIHPQSGVIGAKVDISNDYIWEFILYIEARDSGDEPLSTIVVATVSPQVNKLCTHLTTRTSHNTTVLHTNENLHRNSTIGQLYYLSENTSCSVSTSLYPADIRNMFTINRQGSILSRFPLDRETRDMHCFSVSVIKACREHNVDHTSVAFHNVVVIVDDENDNAPNVVFPDTDNRSIRIYSGAAIDTPLWLAQVKADDIDSDQNAQLSFSIVDQEQFPHLWLDPDTGDLFLVNDIPGDMGSRPVRIRIADNGSPRLSTIALLWIVHDVTEAGGPGSMVDADNLVKVLGIALPCGLLAVLAIVIIVLLARKKFCCQQNSKDHSKPNVDIQLAPEDQDKDKQLDTICKELGLQYQNDIDSRYNGLPLYTEHDEKARCVAEKTITFTGTGTDTKQKSSSLLDVITIPPQTSLSSRDSDSGCSADMSHSTTTDSWVTAAARMDSNSRPCSQADGVTRAYIVPNNYTQLRNGGLGYCAKLPVHPELEHSNNTQDSFNCGNSSYIKTDNVRKYGHVNDAYQSDPEATRTNNYMDIRQQCPIRYHNTTNGEDRRVPTNHVTKNHCHRWRHLSTEHDTVQGQSDLEEYTSPHRTIMGRHSCHGTGVQHMANVHRSVSLDGATSKDGCCSCHFDREIIPEGTTHSVHRSNSCIEHCIETNQFLASQPQNSHPVSKQHRKKKIIYEAQV